VTVGRGDEGGQVTVLIIGFAAMLVMAVVMVIDSSAAYLQRQGLDNLADGAALHGADIGSAGVYAEGLPEDWLLQETEAVRAAVHDYLRASGALDRYPGIRTAVLVDPVERSVTVTLTAPVDLPLVVPGWSEAPTVGASSTAAVTVVDAG
jgi:Putative Flp pilus-assembly TadE/G-like